MSTQLRATVSASPSARPAAPSPAAALMLAIAGDAAAAVLARLAPTLTVTMRRIARTASA